MARTAKNLKRADTNIDYAKVYMLSAEWLPEKTIAIMMGWHPDAFSRRKQRDPMLRNAIDYGREMGVGQIAKKQFDKAVREGDTKMLIHLGKNYLGQSEKSQIDISGSVQVHTIVDVVEAATKELEQDTDEKTSEIREPEAEEEGEEELGKEFDISGLDIPGLRNIGKPTRKGKTDEPGHSAPVAN